jgi:hypothetical protein
MFFSVFAIDLHFIVESHRVFGVATNPALAFYNLVIVYAWLAVHYSWEALMRVTLVAGCCSFAGSDKV